MSAVRALCAFSLLLVVPLACEATPQWALAFNTFMANDYNTCTAPSAPATPVQPPPSTTKRISKKHLARFGLGSLFHSRRDDDEEPVPLPPVRRPPTTEKAFERTCHSFAKQIVNSVLGFSAAVKSPFDGPQVPLPATTDHTPKGFIFLYDSEVLHCMCDDVGDGQNHEWVQVKWTEGGVTEYVTWSSWEVGSAANAKSTPAFTTPNAIKSEMAVDTTQDVVYPNPKYTAVKCSHKNLAAVGVTTSADMINKLNAFVNKRFSKVNALRTAPCPGV